jgi:hypothetical protein
MTATTSNLGFRRGQAVAGHMRRLALAAGPILASVGYHWNAIRDAGQLGPSADSVISRHTGARI